MPGLHRELRSVIVSDGLLEVWKKGNGSTKEAALSSARKGEGRRPRGADLRAKIQQLCVRKTFKSMRKVLSNGVFRTGLFLKATLLGFQPSSNSSNAPCTSSMLNKETYVIKYLLYAKFWIHGTEQDSKLTFL